MMSTLNMNTLHLHATDDEAWRIEIPSLPELTDFAAFRCFDPSGQQCLEPQYGSGPTKTDNEQNGFLSTEDYKSLLTFAMDHQVHVITEINGPGNLNKTWNRKLKF